MLRIGLLGFGQIAQSVHAGALEALPDAQVAAVAERDAARREAAGRHAPGACLFADYRALLEASAADAVVVCLPPALHAEAAVAAFEAGLHVYLEKPIATTLAEARAVVDAGRTAGTVGMMGFNYRFGAVHQEARQHLQEGRLGALAGAQSVFSSASHRLPSWKADRAEGGGVLLDLASHHADLIRYLFDEEITEVSARLRSQQTEADSAAVQFHLASGLSVQSLFSLRATDVDRFEIYGAQGRLVFDRYTSARIERTGTSFAYGRAAQLKREWQRLLHGVQRVLRAPGEPSFAAALGAFADAAQGRPADYPTLEDGYRSLAALSAAEESAATRQPVDVRPLAAASRS